MTKISLQDKYGPNGICFGCGPKNEKGLQIKSFWEGEECVLRFTPENHHRALPGIINGGIIGTLSDCHMNWTAASEIYKKNPGNPFPSTVTSEFSVKLKKPTPAGVELVIKAKPVEVKGNFAKIEAKILAKGEVTATASGTFIAVKAGHPAFHRWEGS